VPSWAQTFGCTFVANQNGTYFIYKLVAGGGSYYAYLPTTYTAGTTIDVPVPVRGASGGSYACEFTNGSTAQTSFFVESSFR
jgi:hypothetical protein